MAMPVEKVCRSIEYHTPAEILYPVHGYFKDCGHQGIECDPATTAANPTKASVVHYTKAEDGLSRPWGSAADSCWLNPPFGRELKLWIAKMHEEVQQGLPVVALLPGQRFEQRYYQRLLFHERLTAWIMIRKRLNFLDENGIPAAGGNMYGSFLFVFNGNWKKAVKRFQPIGTLVEPGRIAHCTMLERGEDEDE